MTPRPVRRDGAAGMPAMPVFDRLEAEPAQFHERVRAAFLALASAEPVRYVVLDATRDPTQLSKTVQAALRERLPDPVPERAEEITGSIPVIRE